MKELSIEEKAKRYDEAIEMAKTFYDKRQPISGGNIIIENIFPELKENEDEKTKRILHSISNKISFHLRDIFTEEEFQCFDAWSNAWFEKQGEHANFINKIQIGDKVTRNEDGVLVNLSQLNRVAKVEEKQGEQKPTDKVEFGIGDLITNGILVGEIDEIHELGYHAYFGDHYADVPDIENWHKWTIKDAKDGDFLVCGKDKLPFIYKGFLDKFHLCPVAYCGICEDGIFSVSSGDGWWTDEEVFPANKEQREQLLKAIADAGYMWNAEKKELKKIEQKSTDEEMKELLRTEYEKGRADAIAEEKERILGKLEEWLDEYISNLADVGTDTLIDSFRKYLDGKLPVKPRNRWKPTEEQMVAIDIAINVLGKGTLNGKQLIELQEQLKAL